MTVRLLKPYAQRPVGAIATFDPSTEAGMIAAKQASADLTGGFEYFLPRPGLKLQVRQVAVGLITLRDAEQAPVLLPEGQVLIVSGGAGTIGKVHLLDVAGGNAPLQSWPVGPGALAPLGPFVGQQSFLVTCSVGDVKISIAEASIANAALPGQLGGVKARVVVVGDSITAYGYDTANVGGKPSAVITNRSIVDMANALMGQRMLILGRAGVFGNRLDQMVSRFNVDVGPLRPNIVILQGASNDIDQGYSAEQIFVSLMAFYKQCQAIGAACIYIGTSGMVRTNDNPIAPPTNTNPKPSPVDGKIYLPSQEFAKLYALARRSAQLLPGFLYYDMALAIRDYTGSTSSTAYGAVRSIAGAPYPPDGTHPTPGHVYPQAVGLANYLNSLFGPAAPDRASLNGYGTLGDPTALFGNPLMIGVAGAVSPPLTGTAPDPVNVSRTGTITADCSTVARTDGGAGRQLQLAISGATALSDFIQLRASQAYNKGAGIPAYLRAAVKVSTVTTGNIYNVIGNMQFLDSGGGLLGQVSFGAPYRDFSVSAGLEGYVGPFPVSDLGLQQSASMKVPAGTATVLYTVRVYTSVGAQITVSVTELGGSIDGVLSSVLAYL